MPERLKAFPTMESRRRVAQRVRDMPDHGGLDLAWPPVVESVERAEEKAVGPLTQHQHDLILSNLANLSLGGGSAAKVHGVTRQQQRQNEAKLCNDDNDKCESSEKKKEVVKVVKDVKEQRKGASNRVPKGFFTTLSIQNRQKS